MDYTVFFWRGEKSSEWKENHSTSAVPKDPQHRCRSWHALVKCAATPASLSTMQPTCIFTTMESTSSFSSVTAPPGVSRTAAVLCCEGASILTPWANRTQQSAGTQLAQGCSEGCTRAQAVPCLASSLFCSQRARPHCFCTGAVDKTLSCSFRQASTAQNRT